jgi:hypothetical protein
VRHGVLAGFFDTTTWLVVRNLVFFFLAVFWLAIGYWTFKDARRRIADPLLVALASILGFVPYVGALVYMLFRPPEYLDEVRERELEIQAMQRLQGGGLSCPVCRAEVDAAYLVCPVCTTRLKEACSSCRAPLEPLWQVCPFCETPVAASAPFDVSDTWESPGPGSTLPSRPRSGE